MIAPEGWIFVRVPVCFGAGALFLGWSWLGWPLIAFVLFALSFFRNPIRVCDQSPDIACFPADGQVVAVGASPLAILGRGAES